MVDINWQIFQAKFHERTTAAFERLAYMLFCYEYKIKVGIFRFKDQAGIETDPIELQGDYIGFQAKFYTTPIASNKDAIIDALNKAKRKNSQLTQFLIYTHQEISESSKPNKKKPEYQIQIENAANNLNLTIEWRVQSHFEKQLSVPENQYLAKYFFTFDKNITDALEVVSTHTKNLLFSIQHDIPFEGRQLQVDRSQTVQSITEATESVIILTGDGGCGKTAIIKQLAQMAASPFYVFKAAEFKRDSLDQVLGLGNEYHLHDFLAAHDQELLKTVVIDSAERLSEIEDLDVFKEFLIGFIKGKWKIIFTTRNIYLDDLCFQITERFRLTYKIERVPNLNPDHLKEIAFEYRFQLPSNERFRMLLTNLFYLDQYLRHYKDLTVETDTGSFREILWQQKVQNSAFKQDNMHLQRQQCFVTLVEQRCNTGNYFLKADGCAPRVLSLLVRDEIIGYDEVSDRHFITHDIYEEWALERKIDQTFLEQGATPQFFQHIGESLPVRRAFRNWLSGKMAISDTVINEFVTWAFRSNGVVQFWKDELMVSILLAEYCAVFFTSFEQVLLENNRTYLKKILFLLRTACVTADEATQKRLMEVGGKVNPRHFFTKPKGAGWSVVITYIHKNLQHFSGDDLNLLLPVWKEWVEHNQKDEVTRATGLSALHYYRKIEVEEAIFLNKKVEGELIKIIFRSSHEIKTELTNILRGFSHESYTRHAHMSDLRDAILSATPESTILMRALPGEVIALLNNAWYQSPGSRHAMDFGGMGTEIHYGIRSQFQHEYSPPSALQTPIYYLLVFDFWPAVTFLLDMINKMVDTYAASKVGAPLFETELTIDGKVVKQWFNDDIWSFYRGAGQVVTPYLLQSIHMALEKSLLEYAPNTEDKTLEEILLFLLRKSKSASVTAVISSVVQAFPERLFNVAKILFTNSHFIRADNIRHTYENRAKNLYQMGGGYGPAKKQYTIERMGTLKQPHRYRTLEDMIVNYQISMYAHDNQELNEYWCQEVLAIIDQLKSQAAVLEGESGEVKAARLLVTRIDSRNFKPKVEETPQGKFLHLNPELETDLKEYSEEGMKAYHERFKFVPLFNWSHTKLDNPASKAVDAQFDDHPEEVMRQTREIVDRMQERDGGFYNMNGMVPAYATSVLMKEKAQQLIDEDLAFCKYIIFEYAGRPLEESYDYQIGDGVEVAVSALPYLLDVFPDEEDKVFITLLFLLFDEYAIGAYKRVCQYAIEAIAKRLMRSHPSLADKILVAYLIWNERFVAFVQEKRRNEPAVKYADLLEAYFNLHAQEMMATQGTTDAIEILNFADLSYRTATNAIEMVPTDTESPLHLILMRKYLDRVFPWVLQETSYGQGSVAEHDIKSIFSKKYAEFLLFRQPIDVTAWLQPFLDNFAVSEETANLISELLSGEIIVKRYHSFWAIWETIYPVAKTASIEDATSRHLHGLWSNFMFAWQWWENGREEWESLLPENAPFFERIAHDVGHLPEVFYSMTKLLNQVGTLFLPQGVKWIAGMLSQHKTIYNDVNINPNAIYYSEVLIRKYCYENRSLIKRQPIIKQRVMVILDFLVRRGSVTGYLLREDLI